MSGDDMDGGRLLIETINVDYLIDTRRKQYQRVLKTRPGRVQDWQPYDSYTINGGQLRLECDGYAIHSSNIERQEVLA